MRDASCIKQPTILMIDDEVVICSSCAQIFEQEGYIIETCSEGGSGLRKFDEVHPDIVFVDLMMPGMTGIEVIQKMREKDADVVLIVITGYATIESAVDSMKHGAFDFLPKPFTPDTLRIITKRALEKRKILLELSRLQEEKEKMRKHFYCMLSHELRTPLVAVMQYLDVFSKGIAGSISDEQNNIIVRMKIRVDELLSLIDRWLKLSMMEDPKLKERFDYFDLIPVVKDVIDIVKPLAQEKNVTLKITVMSENCIIYGDRDMIKEVFTNLLYNGIKYNRDGGMVSIQSKELENFWVIDVVDTGIGIPKEEIPHIVEEFYRIRRNDGKGGAGLGLPIVKKILDFHEGRLEIRSELNHGSTLSVYLPKSKNTD
jgi:two-component system sensor histidine kinase/response regulator